MKQPELGKKITYFRKQQNLTQEELVDRCNVSVRTIQRIEAGEVTPRTSTIKIIMAALGQDMNELKHHDESSGSQAEIIGEKTEAKAILQTAWIAGVIYFVLGLIDAGLDYMNFQGNLEATQRIFFAATKVAVLISYLFFIRGIVLMGQMFDNYLLKISSYLIAAAFLIITAIDIYDIFDPLEDDLFLYIQGGASVTIGAIGLVFGVGFWRLQDGMGRLAALAGVFELLVGLFFLTVVLFFLAYIMLIPATIVEIVLLYKAYELLAKENPATQNGENL